jgi:hypothetical protein
MSQTPNRQQLLQNYDYINKVSLVQTISDSHIRVLRDDIGDEWAELVLRLGLEERDVKLIDLQEQREVMKRHAALHKWKRKLGRRATYLCFLNACMQTRHVALAERMLDLLNEHLKGKYSKVGTTPCVTRHSVMAGYHTQAVQISISLAVTQIHTHTQLSWHVSKVQVRRLINYPCTTDLVSSNAPRPLNTSTRSLHNRSASTEEVDMLSLSHTSISSRCSTESGLGDWLPLEQRLEELRMKYNYTLEVITEYFEKNVTAQMIEKWLLLVPHELKQLQSYLKVKNEEDKNAFSKLLSISNFRQPILMQQLVGDVGDTSCKRAMALYQEDLHSFNCETTMGEFSKDWLHKQVEPDTKLVTLVLGARWDSRTMQEFEEFNRKLQRRAHLNMYDLELCNMQSTSVQATLALAAEHADLSNFKHVDTAFYKANNVLRVTGESSVIYDVESPMVGRKPCSCTLICSWEWHD